MPSFSFPDRGPILEVFVYTRQQQLRGEGRIYVPTPSRVTRDGLTAWVVPGPPTARRRLQQQIHYPSRHASVTAARAASSTPGPRPADRTTAWIGEPAVCTGLADRLRSDEYDVMCPCGETDVDRNTPLPSIVLGLSATVSTGYPFATCRFERRVLLVCDVFNRRLKRSN